MSLHSWRSTVTASQAAVPLSRSTLNGAELPLTKKVLRLHTQGHFSRVQLFATLWFVVYQASLSVGFSRQEYWSVLANTGCHTFPENYISCCPSHQLP